MTAERAGERPAPVEVCQRCGAPVPDRANFCPNCGAPVSVSAASERRVVTVVFADLAGSTELAAMLDPERFRDVLAAFHGMVSDEITALGGRAEGFIGDAVLGVFGVPLLHDDDAERGVRAGLAIAERAERIGARLELPAPVGVRVGVNTGQVAVGTATDRNIVIGAEVNIGARLQQAARPGEVLVGERTRLLVGDAIEFGDPRLIEAKGFDAAMPAWRALGVVGAQTRRSISLVNRRRELALLTDTFERVRVRERAHLVTLLGEPGIGKTRVVEEFLAGLPEGVRVLAGRSSAFEESVTFWPLAQMVYREIGTDRHAPDDEVTARLRDWVGTLVPPQEVDEAARRLAMALGVEDDLEEQRYHGAELRQGLLSVLTGLAAEGPVVLVFEDLEEAYPLLLDLIEQLVKEARKVPLMVLCVARWEFLERRPNWAGGIADNVTMWVEPLTLGHAAELAMEAGGLRHEDAERIAQHAGGNPFFIVEIVGMLRREERDLPPRGPAPSGRLLPPTVQAVIATRIDQLSPSARELVRRASVFPQGASTSTSSRSSWSRAGSCSRRPRTTSCSCATRTGRGCGGSDRTCCATSPTTRWPSASDSACTCAWRTGSPRGSRRTGSLARRRSTSSTPRRRPWTSIPGIARSPSERSRRSRVPATSSDAATSRGRRPTSTSARSPSRVPRTAGGTGRPGSSACSGRPGTGWVSSRPRNRPCGAPSRSAATRATASGRTRRASSGTSRSRSTATRRGRTSSSKRPCWRRGGWESPPSWRARCSWRAGCRSGRTTSRGPSGCSGRRSTWRDRSRAATRGRSRARSWASRT